MTSPVADLEVGLQAMLSLKPPGVSGSRITSLTKLCLDNVQSESVLVQKLYTHFKKAPASHKLGVLYVVDSVTRKWMEQAKSHGQHVDGSAPDGTYAAGVYRVTELLPVLMNDIIQFGQKDKITKLLDIWEKVHTFPLAMIEGFREKLKSTPEPIQSTTPEGSPPPDLVEFMGYHNRPSAPAAPTPPSAQQSNAIMEALANLARQNNSTAPAPSKPAAPAPAPLPVPVPAPAQAQAQNTAQSNALSVLSNLQHVTAQHQQKQAAAAAAPIHHHQPAFSMPSISQPAATAPPFSYAPPQPPVQPASVPYPGATPMQQPPAAPIFDAQAQQQLMLIKTLADQGVPLDKIPSLLAALKSAQPGAIPAAPATTAAPNYYTAAQGWGAPHQSQSNDNRDQHRYGDGSRSSSRTYGRSRSRSPSRRWDTRGSPRGSRDDYGQQSPGRNRHDDRDARGRGSEYRQRSPVGRNGRSPAPRHSSGEKWVDFDSSIPKGSIKVLSRTLFVGGVQYTERELREIFSEHGQVQTCIVNKEKRHAFVKMICREDAVRAKKAMEKGRENDSQLRTRWGVGFGPRDCSDYATGVSIIPINKLTEADRKWMLTAEYGGSGGRAIETGLVVEEPDIEIGAGVSSKAISRRMQTDKSGHHGPRSTRSGRDEDRDDLGRWRRNNNSNNNRRDDNPASGANAQPVPQQFPYGIPTLPNGMPAFPAGFTFPDPNAQ